MLQSDPAVTAAAKSPAKAPAGKMANAPVSKTNTAKPDNPNAAAAPATDPGAGAMGAMAGQLAKGGAAEPNTMANAPVSKTNTAKPGNPNAAPAAEPTAAPAPQKKAVKPDADAATQAKVAAAPNGYDQDTGEPIQAPAADPAAPPKRTGGRVKGQLSQDPRAVKRREANAAKTKQQAPAASQAEIDADRERIMGVTSDSIVRRQPMMAESFSLFRKR